MKKLFLSFVAAIVTATVTYAQDVYVATLNHEGTITEYYGSTAFETAYNAAVDGDIITLSEGEFTFDTGSGSQTKTITKSITIRGIGMSADNVYGLKQTTISGIRGGKADAIRISGTKNKTVEGIYFTDITFGAALNNSSFYKCRMGRSDSRNHVELYDQSSNNTFSNCIIINPNIYPTGNNNVFRNCYITGGYQRKNLTLFNCFFRADDSYVSQITDSDFTNCIIATRTNLPASNKLANCVGISLNTSNTTDIFVNIPEKLGCSMATTDIFNSWSDAISTTNVSPESFELSVSGKQYRGVDNTEVGMLGGNYPYNPVVSIPRNTKCEVAEKATADGKLSVNIEVTAPTNE